MDRLPVIAYRPVQRCVVGGAGLEPAASSDNLFRKMRTTRPTTAGGGHHQVRHEQPALTMTLAPKDSTRFLFAMFEGGGNLSLILPIVAELVRRGHDVRVLAGPNVRAGRRPMSERFVERIRATGAAPVILPAPATHPFDEVRFRGLVDGWTPQWLERLTPNCAPLVWSTAWATGLCSELDRASADVVAADFILLGALAAAEGAGVPSAALVHGTWKHRPAPGATPYGAGFLPSRSVIGRLHAVPYNTLIAYRYRRDGLPPLNRARRRLGLAPLRSPFEQYDRIARVLILSSAAFDIPPDPLPPNVRYVGSPLEHESSATWQSPWQAEDPRPLVLISLSTLPQGQGPLLKRVLEAVGTLPVRALVTVGPSLDRADFMAPPNAVLETFVPHGAVMPLASAMVTQCGLGTLAKALSASLPLVCLPLVADQPGNAALVAAHGAGVSLHPRASPAHIARAIRRVLTEPSFRGAAGRLASHLANENGAQSAASELVALAPTTAAVARR